MGRFSTKKKYIKLQIYLLSQDLPNEVKRVKALISDDLIHKDIMAYFIYQFFFILQEVFSISQLQFTA